jgi:hypothetical protein
VVEGQDFEKYPKWILKKTGCGNRTTLAATAAAQAQERFGAGKKIR